MSPDELEKAVACINADAKADRQDEAWAGVQTLLRAQQEQEQEQEQESVALAIIAIVESGILSHENSLSALEEVHRVHGRNARVLGCLGQALEQARDIDLLNAPPPEHPLFEQVTNALTDLVDEATSAETEANLLEGLSTAARMMARQADEVAEKSYRRLIELDPKTAYHHYNLGLFLKSRGRFREGIAANETAELLTDKRPEAYEWNLGICATGAREGRLALQVWKRLKQKIEMGRFDLPDGRYPQCKVRLAQRPLAERAADADDPGLEETIWIERLSPCHGIIRSVLYQDVGVDYGDVILFDGAPITYHTYGDDKVPVFPHLATLVRNNYRVFDFAGTQDSAGQIAGLSSDLERDAVVYSHSENYVVLCASCWRNPDVNHKHGRTLEKHAVIGRIAAPADFDLGELLRQLDAAIAKREPCRIYAPDLCEAAGLADRAAFERRRLEMIRGNLQGKLT